MKHGDMLPGIFLSRPNRFIAHIEIGGQVEVCHVKNTGRCKELLPPGASVWCRYDENPARKTKFDLIAAIKQGRLINMDSQAPNGAAEIWLRAGGLGEVQELRREFTHGDSRFDFTFLKEGKRCFLEVKGVTLEENNIARFPDAPTQRGTKHLKGLAEAVKQGFGAYVLFVIQMSGIRHFEPNAKTDPAFAAALKEAAEAGVRVMAVGCKVTPGQIEIAENVPVVL